MFFYELSGCAFESSCSHLNFRFRACFKQGAPWHSGNYRVWFHSETGTWHDKSIQSNAFVSWCNFSSSFVNCKNFFFSKSIIFFACFLKVHKTFSYNLFYDMKYVCFLYSQIPKLLTLSIRKKYAHLFFVVEEFSRLFAHPSIFLIKYFVSA